MASFDLAVALPQVGPYRYGDNKWDDYLLDVQRAIVHSSMAQVAAVHEAADQATRHLDGVRADLNWGFTLLHDQLESNLQELRAISERLRRIESILAAPQLTRAREAFSIGLQHLRQGLLVKALERFAEAETINDVDFLLQLNFGKLLLYGRNEDENVVNLDSAESHLTLARRYAAAARVDLGTSVESHIAESSYHLAVTAYLRSSIAASEGDLSSGTEHLQTALRWLQQIATPTPQHLYLLAQCWSLLGHSDDANQILLQLADADRSYPLLAQQNPDFAAIWEHIPGILAAARQNPGPATQQAFSRRQAVLAEVALARECDVDNIVGGYLPTATQLLADIDADFEQGAFTARLYAQKCDVLIDTIRSQARKAVNEQIRRVNQQIKAVEDASADERRRVRNGPEFQSIGAVLIGCVFVCWAVVGLLFGDWEPPTQWDNFALGLWFVTSVILTFVLYSVDRLIYSRAVRRVRTADHQISTLQERVKSIRATHRGLLSA